MTVAAREASNKRRLATTSTNQLDEPEPDFEHDEDGNADHDENEMDE